MTSISTEKLARRLQRRAESRSAASAPAVAAQGAHEDDEVTAGLAGQARAYTGTLWWVLREAITQYPLQLLGIIALNLFSLAAGAATFGAVVLYARHVETGSPVIVGGAGGLQIPLPTGLTNLLIFAAAITAVGLFAGYARHVANRASRRTAVRHSARCMMRALRIAADPACRGWQLLLPGSARTAMTTILVRDARVTALALRRVLAGTLPVAMFLVAAAALIITNPLLTGLLIPLALGYLPPLYLINRAVARHQRAYRQASPAARRILKRAFDQLTAGAEPLESRLARAADDVESEAQLEAHRLFHERRIALSRIQLLNTTFFVLAVTTLFTYFAIQTQRGQATGGEGGGGVAWSELLLYVIALQFAVVGLRQITALFVQLSRMMPEVQQYVGFVKRAERLAATAGARGSEREPLPETITLRCQAPDAWSCPESIELARGKLLWVVLPWRPAPADLHGLAVALERSCAPALDLSSTCEIIAPQSDEYDSDDDLDDNNDDVVVDGASRAAPAPAALREAGVPTPSPELIIMSAAALDEQNLRTLAANAPAGQPPYFIAVTHRPENLFESHLDLRADDVAGVAVLGERWQVLACGDLDWARDTAGELLAQLSQRAARRGEDDDEDDDDEIDD